MYSDEDDDFEDSDHGPIVVEVKEKGRHRSPASSRLSPVSSRRSPSPRLSPTPRRGHSAKHRHSPSRHSPSRHSPKHRHAHRDEEDLSDFSEEDFDEDEDEEELYSLEREAPSPLTARGHTTNRHGRQSRTKNGKKAVNMTMPDKLLASAKRKAEKLADMNKPDRAIQERVKALALTRIVYGSNHWRLAEAHVDLAQDYLELKAYNAQAEYHTENAMTIMLNSVHTTSTEREKSDVFGVLFQLNYIQGKALIALKKFTEADAALMKADRAYQALSKLSTVTDDECDEMEIKYTQEMARLSWRQKKYAVAGSQFDKVLDLTRRRFGDDAIELIAVYQDCGKLEQSKGRHANHEKAIEMFLQAHSIASANYKHSSIELVDTALAVARAYASTGREEAESSAEKYLNDCLTSCTMVYGPEHKKTLEVQDELARLHIRTEREQEALDLLRSSIPLKNEAYGDYSETVSDTHKLIASVHLAQGNIEKALHSYKKCLNIETLVLGKNHRKTKDTERTIDILLASPGLSKKFVLNKEDELKKRPRFNAVSKARP